MDVKYGYSHLKRIMLFMITAFTESLGISKVTVCQVSVRSQALIRGVTCILGERQSWLWARGSPCGRLSSSSSCICKNQTMVDETKRTPTIKQFDQSCQLIQNEKEVCILEGVYWRIVAKHFLVCFFSFIMTFIILFYQYHWAVIRVINIVK